MEKLFITLALCLLCTNPCADEQKFLFQVLGEPARYQNDLSLDCHQPEVDDSNWPELELQRLDELRHYCLRIPVTITNEPLSPNTVLFISVLGSYEAHWDGQPLAKKGIPAENILHEKTGPVSQKIPMAAALLSPGEHLLSLRLSTYHHDEDLFTIFYGIILVDSEALSHEFLLQLIPAFLLIGAMLSLFFFWQFFYWLYRKDSAYLVFSLLCFFSSLLIALEFVKFVYDYYWDWHVTRVRAITVVTFLTGLLLPYYYSLYFRLEGYHRWLAGLAILFMILALTLPGYDYKSLAIFTGSLVATSAITITAVFQKRKGALIHTLVLLGGLLLLVSISSSFIEKWFAAVYSVIALANLHNLVTRFALDREKALNSLRLQSELLRRNIQPHFLLNSLTLIVEWIEVQPKLAVRFVESLAEEFRLLNKMSLQKLVPLDDEINLCKKHVAIMAYRYQKEIYLKVNGILPNTMIPPAILHTVIENAFSHNKIANGDPFEIHLDTEQERYCIRIITPFRRHSHDGTGTGIEYIRARLTESFNMNWRLESQADGDHWNTKFSLPIIVAGS